MILRAISSLMATRDSLTLTMTFPPSEDTSVTRTAGHEAQIFQVALGLCVSANLQDHVLLADVCQCKRHHSGTLHYTR